MKKFISLFLSSLLLFLQVSSASEIKNNLSILKSVTIGENTTIGKSVKIGNEYVEAKNKVDGSFEKDTAFWASSNGTIVRTANTATTTINGNYNGVWSGTGTATLDLQWTATASNTYEPSVIVQLPTGQTVSNYTICAVVNGVETGCKILDTCQLDRQCKVSVVADSVLGSAFYLRLKHTGSGAFSAIVDSGKIEAWTPNVANLTTQEAISYIGYTSRDSGTSFNLFKTKDTTRSNYSSLVTDSHSASGSYTKYTVLKKNISVVSFSANSYGDISIGIRHYNSSGVLIKQTSTRGGSSGRQSSAMTTSADVGDYFVIYSSVAPTMVDDTEANFSITAQAVSENIVQSYQDGMSTWSATSTIQIGATTTAPTKGATDLDQVKYVKNGANGEFWYQYNQTAVGSGSAGSGDYLFSLPNGMQFASEVTKYTTPEGSGDWIAKNGISAGTWTGTGNYGSSAFVLPYDSTRFRVGLVGGSSGSTLFNGVAGSSIGSLNNSTISFSLKFSAPIQGWSAAPPLLALPTSKENVFSANFDGVSSIINKSSDWIESISISDTSLIRINFKAGLFTVLPTVTIGTYDSTVLADLRATISSMTTSYVEIRTGYSTANQEFVKSLRAFQITVVKNAPDYTAPGVFVGNVQPEWQYDLTVTGTNWATTRAVGVVYKMGSGQYRMRFNIVGVVSSQSANTLTVSNVTFKNITNYKQAIATTSNIGNWHIGRCYPNASTIEIAAGGNVTQWELSGDVELESKPTWATFTL